MFESCHTYESCRMHEWVMSQTWMGRVTCTSSRSNTYESCQVHVSCHMNEWVMVHVWMRHVVCMNESCHFRKQLMTLSTENAAPPKSTTSRNSNSLVQIKSKFQFELVPHGPEKSEFLDLVDFWGAAFSMKTGIGSRSGAIRRVTRMSRVACLNE